MSLKLSYVLQLADNALISGQRLSEWCGHGPILEQDIAITNTALDHIGQARSLFQYAAQLYNELSNEAKLELFTSPALNNITEADEDNLAYLRDAWDFKNVLLVETPNEDWAYTIARSFFYDQFSYLLYSALSNASDETIQAIAIKSLKEVTYHKKWSAEWIIRLGDGTAESKERIQQAINDRWPYTQELFMMSAADTTALQEGYGADLNVLAPQWHANIQAVLEEATLTIPTETWGHRGGKEGVHTEFLGYILAEMQFMQRAYPNMEW